MSTFTDLEKDAVSVDGFVNENALVVTRRNGPKPSWQYIVDQVYAQLGYAVAGSFITGFTYTGIRQVGVDASGKTWIYAGGQQNIPHVVDAGTIPSEPEYFQVSVNSADNVVLDNGENLQQAIDRLNDETEDLPELIRAFLIAQGLSGNYGFFEKGFDYVQTGDVGIDVDGKIYTYVGNNALPVNVAAGVNPVGDEDYCLELFSDKILNSYSILDFTKLKPEDVMDWLPIYEAAKGKLNSIGGGYLVWPYIGGYPVSNTVWQPSNVDMLFNDELVATTIMSPYECIISPDVGAENINTYGLRVNGNNLPAVSGLMPRRGCSNIKYFGVSGRNLAHDKVRKGGRLFSPQGGSDGGGNLDIQVFGLHGKDIYNYIDIAGDSINKNSNIVVNGGTVENCEVPFTSFNTEPNYANYPQPAQNLSALISDITCKNVGVSTTYIRNGGVINSSAGSNILYRNITINNDSNYTSTRKPNVLMGKFSGFNVENLVYNGDCSFMIDGHLWDEADATNQDGTLDILDSDIEIKVNGEALGSVYIQPKDGGGINIERTNIKLKVKTFGDPLLVLNPAYSPRPSCNIDFTNTTLNRGVSGSFSQIAPLEVTLSKLNGFLDVRSGVVIDNDSVSKELLGQVEIKNFNPAIKLVDKSSGGVGWSLDNDSGSMTLSYDFTKTNVWQNIWQWNSSRMKPFVDNQQSIGDPSQRVKDLFLVNAPTVGSDSRTKDYIKSIPQDLIDFVLSVEIKSYKLKEGDSGRNHFGIIIDSDLIENLSKVYDVSEFAALCQEKFTDFDGNQEERSIGGVSIGDIWLVRYDEWQNIILEGLRRKAIAV